MGRRTTYLLVTKMGSNSSQPFHKEGCDEDGRCSRHTWTEKKQGFFNKTVERKGQDCYYQHGEKDKMKCYPRSERLRDSEPSGFALSVGAGPCSLTFHK